MTDAMIPKRIVLDTNVCLDLFVFCDPRWETLRNAISDRAVQPVTRADCRQEWLLVLRYPHLPLNDKSRLQAQTEFDEQITLLTELTPAPIVLPRCKDKDDQKFLELATDCQAHSLVTKDKALLKLAGKVARLGLFSIVTPQRWCQQNA